MSFIQFSLQKMKSYTESDAENKSIRDQRNQIVAHNKIVFRASQQTKTHKISDCSFNGRRPM